MKKKIKITPTVIHNSQEMEHEYTKIRPKLKEFFEYYFDGMKNEARDILDEINGFEGLEELLEAAKFNAGHPYSPMITLTTTLSIIDSFSEDSDMDWTYTKLEIVLLFMAFAYETKLRLEAEKNNKTLTENFNLAIKELEAKA